MGSPIINSNRLIMVKFFKIVLMILFGFLKSQQVDYQIQIQSIFDQNCTNCHGASGGLALGSYDELMSGGNSGDVVIPGDYLNSILWQRIDSGDMPPGGEISSSQMELIEDWISQGALEEVLEADIIETIPKKFSLYQNYPNPFNPSTYIKYYIPKFELITLDIFNLKGNHIKSLINSNLYPGTYLNIWDSTDKNGLNVPAGIYIYILKSQTINESKKMILLK